MVTLPDGIPITMSYLPLNKVGYPVPWFVARKHETQTEDFDFRVIRAGGIQYALRNGVCWVCGQEMGMGLQGFVIGPMCAVNRTSAEPPSHITCARWSAKACPFLATPKMVRRERGIDHYNVAGEMIARNPGVALVWGTRPGHWETFSDGQGGTLFYIGEPIKAEWYAQGREATHDEVLTSIESGLPILRGYCDGDDDPVGAHADLDNQVAAAMPLVPA